MSLGEELFEDAFRRFLSESFRFVAARDCALERREGVELERHEQTVRAA